ncbi:MAG: NAD(P)-dependent alcohol dehydrogenase [Thermomicrobiales bacterium]
MRAAVYTRYGPPEVVRVVAVEKPVPTAGEVLVRVHAATVSRSDCGLRTPYPIFFRPFIGLTRPRRQILGGDFAGRVEAIGSGVTRFRKGDRIFGLTGGRLGSHADYVCLPADGAIAPMPANIAYDEAAAVSDGAHMALGCLRKAGLHSGQRLLIYGASGSIGSAAVQLARHFGADITAVCGTRNLELARSLGAQRVLDYTHDDFIRGDAPYDVVLDAVGKTSYRRCRHLVRDGGVFIETDLGFLWQNPMLVLWTSRVGTRRVLIPVSPQRAADIAFFAELIAAGSYRAVIDRRFPLEQVADAYRYVDQGHKTGNVVLTIGDTDAA